MAPTCRSPPGEVSVATAEVMTPQYDSRYEARTPVVVAMIVVDSESLYVVLRNCLMRGSTARAASSTVSATAPRSASGRSTTPAW